MMHLIIIGVLGYIYQESAKCIPSLFLALIIQDNVEIRKLSFLLYYYLTVAAGRDTPPHPLKKHLKHLWIIFDALFKSNHPLPVRLGTCAPSWVVRVCGTGSLLYCWSDCIKKLILFPSREQAISLPWAPQVVSLAFEKPQFSEHEQLINRILREWHLTLGIEKPSLIL